MASVNFNQTVQLIHMDNQRIDKPETLKAKSKGSDD